MILSLPPLACPLIPLTLSRLYLERTPLQRREPHLVGKVSQPKQTIPSGSPLYSRKQKENLLASTKLITQRINLPALFACYSKLNFQPFSTQALLHRLPTSSLQQVSTPLNKQHKLSSPNLIHEEKPSLFSRIFPKSFSPTSSIEVSKNLDSIANPLPPLLIF